jgi:hypothetical protein
MEKGGLGEPLWFDDDHHGSGYYDGSGYGSGYGSASDGRNPCDHTELTDKERPMCEQIMQRLEAGKPPCKDDDKFCQQVMEKMGSPSYGSGSGYGSGYYYGSGYGSGYGSASDGRNPS